MKKVIFYGIVVLALVACGGGTGGSGGSATIDPEDINLTKDMQDGKIQNYDSTDPIEDQYLAVINYLRSLAIKCNDTTTFTGPSDTLVWNDQLEAAAKEHSNDMNTSGHYAHIGSSTSSDITGKVLGYASSPKDRVDATGYTWYAGENIARLRSYYETAGGKPSGYTPVNNNTWVTVMEGWVKSTDGHCSNIMNPSTKSLGMSEVGSRVDTNATHTIYSTYWTQEFGSQ